MSPKGVPTIQPAKSVEYETPRSLFDELWNEFGGFDLDPCCRPEHYTAQRVLENGGEIMIPPPPNEVDPNLPTISGPAHAPHGGQHIYYDGLKMSWLGKVWLQPPYGNALKLWIPKAVEEVKCGNAELVVALLPSKTDVKWWAEYVLTYALYQTNSLDPYGGQHIYLINGELARSFQAAAHPLLAELRFIKGRLKFAGEDGPARHGSVIVVWRK